MILRNSPPTAVYNLNRGSYWAHLRKVTANRKNTKFKLVFDVKEYLDYDNLSETDKHFVTEKFKNFVFKTTIYDFEIALNPFLSELLDENTCFNPQRLVGKYINFEISEKILNKKVFSKISSLNVL